MPSIPWTETPSSGSGRNARGPPVAGKPYARPQGYKGPYVSYPNDPYNYYTMNGQNRVMPGYYRPY